MAAITRLSLDGYGARRAGSFDGKTGTATVIAELDDSAGSGKYSERKRKRKQHENLPFTQEDYVRSLEQSETQNSEQKALETTKPVVEAKNPEPLSAIDREIQGYLMDMGLIDPLRIDRIIEENERLDRQRRQMAAIALLLLD